MWSTWLIKSRTDLRQRWLQAVVLAVMLVAGTAAFAMAMTVGRSTPLVFERVHEEARGADVWLRGDAVGLARAARLPEVAEAGDVLPAVEGELIHEGEAHGAVVFGLGATPDPAPGLITEGRWAVADRDDEVVIGGGLARSAGIALGDRLLLVAPNARAASYEVVGIVTPTFRVPYPQLTPAAVFVTAGALEELAGAAPSRLDEEAPGLLGLDAALGVRLAAPDALDAFVGVLPEGVSAVSWQETRDAVVNETRGPSTMLRVFSIFAALATSFVVAATIANHAMAQRREIGLLKAVGLTPRQTSMLLLGQMLAISVPASLLGIAIGAAGTPYFQWSIKELLDAEPVTSLPLPTLVAAFLAVQALVVVSAALPARRAGRTRIVDAVATGSRQPAAGSSLVARAADGLHLPQVVVVGVKDVFTRPLRSWLTVAAIAVAAATLMMTFSLRHSLGAILDDPALIGSSPHELQARLLGELTPARAGQAGLPASTLTHEEAAALVSAQAGVETFVSDRSSEILVGDATVLAHAIDGDLGAMGFQLGEGRLFSEPGEAVVGIGLARALDLAMGDTLEIELLPGHKTALTVVGTYFVDENQGVALMYGLDAPRALDPSVEPGSFNIRLRDRGELDAVVRDLSSASGGELVVTDLTRETDANISDGRQLVLPMTLLGVGLSALAAANLLSSLVFSVRERTPEFGVLKSIGFTPLQVVAVVMVGVAPLALIGTLVGAPLGYLLLDQLFRSAAEAHQPTDIIQLPPPLWIVVLVATALAITFVGSFVPAVRAGRLGVSEALRAE